MKLKEAVAVIATSGPDELAATCRSLVESCRTLASIGITTPPLPAGVKVEPVEHHMSRRETVGVLMKMMEKARSQEEFDALQVGISCTMKRFRDNQKNWLKRRINEKNLAATAA